MRLDYRQVAPEAVQAMRELEAYVKSTGLEPPLLELVKIRASQLNGCAYCIDLHTRNARAAGEAERRIYALSTWQETPFFSARERAALAWAEAVTLLAEGGVPDDVYEEARRHFTDRELVDLTMAVVAINGWNRLAVAFRLPPEGRSEPSPDAPDPYV